MIYSFLQKYRLTIEDYYDLAAIGLCKAATSFDNTKSVFSTYAYKCMYTIVFTEIRNEKANKRIPEHQILYYQAEIENNNDDTACFMNFIPSKENVEDTVISEIIFIECINKLSDKDKQILELLSNGYKQEEISKRLGCSRSNVGMVKKKFIDYMMK